MGDLGKILIYLGGAVVVIGIVLILLGKTGLPIGRLPGDVVYRGKSTTVYFPIVTCVVLSLVLSVVMYLIQKMR
jgi:uncharacterized membrane-anchored protein YitT (DUF2179 family)